MKFNKNFDTDQWGNIYTSECGVYILYRERTFKNNGTSKADGDWIVQKNGQVLMTFPTLKKAKQVCFMNSLS